MNIFERYPLAEDTSLESEQILFDLLRVKSPAEKLRMVCTMSAAMRKLALTGLRQRHPDDTEEDTQLRMVELLYGSSAKVEIYEQLLLRKCERRAD
jgi:hypothetical protein